MTPRDERHAFTAAEPDDRLDFSGVLRQHDGSRYGTQVDEGVGLVRQKIRRVLKETAGSDDAGKITQEVWVHGLER